MLEDVLIRQQSITLALSVVGLTAPSPEYDALICVPGDNAADMRRESGCGLVVRGLRRLQGAPYGRYLGVYDNGKAPRDCIEEARARGALRPDVSLFLPGDRLIIENPWHILTMTGQDGLLVHSVDGGQRINADDKIEGSPYAIGAETIKVRTRRLEMRNGRPYLDGRPLVMVLDGGIA